MASQNHVISLSVSNKFNRVFTFVEKHVFVSFRVVAYSIFLIFYAWQLTRKGKDWSQQEIEQ